MLILWMAYATVLGTLVAAGGLAGERLVGIWSGARRGVWIVSLALVTLAPVVLATRRGNAAPPAGADVTGDVIVRLTPMAGAPAGGAPPASAPLVVAPWNRYAAAAWALASLLSFAVFARGVVAVRRGRRAWASSEVAGRRVLVAEDVGPAVVGVLRPAIVIPRWALALAPDEQTLMLRHEAEHVAAGDPLLLHLAALAIVLFPWNAALWYVVQRLRLAIEIDCDARVLRAGAAPRDYAMLLLSVGSRHAVSLPHAASLAERRPLLERRILAMTTLRPAHPLAASLPLLAIVVVTATLAAQTPRPVPLPPAAAVASAASVASVASPPALARAALRTAPAAPALPALPAPHASRAMVEAPLAPEAPSPARAPRAIPARGPEGREVQPLAPLDTPPTPAAPARRLMQDVPLEVIRGWIERYHPSILAGDAAIGVVTIVVDANGQYVSSVTDAVPNNTLYPADRVSLDGIASVEVLKGPAAAAAYGAAAANGVVVITTKRALADPTHASVDTTVAMAVARTVGARALQGVPNVSSKPLFIVDGIIIDPPPTETPRADERGTVEKQLGVTSEGIESVQILKLAPGRIGPNALRVVLIELKA